MKNLFVAAFLLISLPSTTKAVERFSLSNHASISESQAAMPSKVVFRTNQRLKSNDGEEIRLRTDGTCEIYMNDICVRVCLYTIISYDHEIQLLDEYGNIMAKASFTYASDRLNISTLVCNGKKYFRF